MLALFLLQHAPLLKDESVLLSHLAQELLFEGLWAQPLNQLSFSIFGHKCRQLGKLLIKHQSRLNSSFLLAAFHPWLTKLILDYWHSKYWQFSLEISRWFGNENHKNRHQESLKCVLLHDSLRSWHLDRWWLVFPQLLLSRSVSSFGSSLKRLLLHLLEIALKNFSIVFVRLCWTKFHQKPSTHRSQ